MIGPGDSYSIPRDTDHRIEIIEAGEVIDCFSPPRKGLFVVRDLEMTSIRQRAIDGIKVGDEVSASRTFTEQDMVQFADVSRDYNPIHLDDRFAKAKKFKGRICHGLLVGSMLTEIGGQIAYFASHMDFVFKKPVYFGIRSLAAGLR